MRRTSLPPAGARSACQELPTAEAPGQRLKLAAEAVFTPCPPAPSTISKIWKSCSSSLKHSCSCLKAQHQGFGDQTPVKVPKTPSSLTPPHNPTSCVPWDLQYFEGAVECGPEMAILGSVPLHPMSSLALSTSRPDPWFTAPQPLWPC